MYMDGRLGPRPPSPPPPRGRSPVGYRRPMGARDPRTMAARSGDEFSAHCSRRVWPGADALVAFCAEFLPKAARVIELGAGTGHAALELSRLRHDVTITATEAEACGSLDHLCNAVRDAPRVRAARLDWARADEDVEAAGLGDYDAIMGSELVYNDQTAKDVAACLARLLQRWPTATCTIAQSVGRWGGSGYDAAWAAALAAAGLAARAVAPAGVHPAWWALQPARQVPVVFLIAKTAGGHGPEEGQRGAGHDVLLAPSLAAEALAEAERARLSPTSLAEVDAAAAIAQLWWQD